MEGKRVGAEEVKRAVAADVGRLAEEVAEAMNAAQEAESLPTWKSR